MPPPSAATAQHVYLKTDGTRVARVHLSDWIVLVLLAVIDGVLNIIEPFHRFVGEDMIPGLRFPLKPNTVPVWAVPVLAVVGPVAIIVGVYMKRRNVYDLHHAILGKSSARTRSHPQLVLNS
jgi:diacylglycerol diphosphate phosphatase / phosphatidate phosphatase